MDRHLFLNVTNFLAPYLFWGTVGLVSVCLLVIIFATVFHTVFGSYPLDRSASRD